MPRAGLESRQKRDEMGCAMQLAHVAAIQYRYRTQPSMPVAEPESEPRLRLTGPISMVGSVEIISASMSMTGLGTVLS